MNPEAILITDAACYAICENLEQEMVEFGLRPVLRFIHRLASKLNMLRTYSSISSSGKKGIHRVPSRIKMSYSLKNFNPNGYTITTETLEDLLF